ncbi:MAG TPA: sigma-70 family RNA polymerase sigma factor [Steroidobacteraceae bacterium]|nr:sigma-70 family RNA polymerase sigma factor [Steroidobacteraceae bacterium]
MHGTEEGQRFFAAVIEPLRADLYRFALWLARDRQVAEDVVQETLLRAWRSLDSLKDAQAAKHWLLTIARREHARLYERKRHETANLDDLIAVESPMLASEHNSPDDEVHTVRRAILNLDEEYREPLVLQVLMGYTTEEIATHMNLNQGAVLTRLFRARNRLRAQLGLSVDEEEAI